jgi:superfamily II RNA helicase
MNYYFYEIVFDWANQKDFGKIAKANNIEEGLIVRMITGVGHICKDMGKAAQVIGNGELKEKMEEA